MAPLLLWCLVILLTDFAKGAIALRYAESGAKKHVGMKWRALSNTCTAEGVQLAASARKTTVRMTGKRGAIVHIKLTPTRRSLVNATLVLDVSPEGTAVYKKALTHPPLLRAKEQTLQPVVPAPGHVLWPGLTVEQGKTQRFKIKFKATDCATEQGYLSVSVSLLYQGSGGPVCAMTAYPIKVS